MRMQKHYKCESCGYEFKANSTPKVCPYCGKKGKVNPLKTANEILEDISKE